MNKLPGLLDILQAVFDLYEKGERKAVISLYPKEADDLLRAKGFSITDTLVWERLYEYNKTVQIVDEDDSWIRPGSKDKTITYWLCQQDIERKDKDKADTMPMMFKMGMVANEIAALTRKRELEEEQLRFWNIYKWAAIATIGLAGLTAFCQLLNVWISCHKP